MNALSTFGGPIAEIHLLTIHPKTLYVWTTKTAIHCSKLINSQEISVKSNHRILKLT